MKTLVPGDYRVSLPDALRGAVIFAHEDVVNRELYFTVLKKIAFRGDVEPQLLRKPARKK